MSGHPEHGICTINVSSLNKYEHHTRYECWLTKSARFGESPPMNVCPDLLSAIVHSLQASYNDSRTSSFSLYLRATIDRITLQQYRQVPSTTQGLEQGDRSPGKPGIGREQQSGHGRVGKNGKDIHLMAFSRTTGISWYHSGFY